MKLVLSNMRAMCDWVVADRSITSHRLDALNDNLQITVDTPGGLLVINHGQWLIKDEFGKFTVEDE